jgi:hypothetical protein
LWQLHWGSGIMTQMKDELYEEICCQCDPNTLKFEEAKVLKLF